MAQSWWLAAGTALILPHYVIGPAFAAIPPPAGPFQQNIKLAAVFCLGFLAVGIWMGWRWRDRLPPVTSQRWYGPADTLARVRGYGVLWSLIALHTALVLGLLAPRAVGQVLITGPAAYLRPDLEGFFIEPLNDGSGLIHLTLVNQGRHAIPLQEGQRIGEVVVDSPSGPALLGRAQSRFSVLVTAELTGRQPAPDTVAAGDSVRFLLPWPQWGAIAEGAPSGLLLTIRYFPASSPVGPVYQPLDLYDGPLHGLLNE